MNLSIVLKLADVQLLLSALQKRIDGLNPTTSSLPDQGQCSGIVLKDYLETVQAFGELLKKYQELLKKDLGEIEENINTLLLADRTAGQTILKKTITAVQSIQLPVKIIPPPPGERILEAVKSISSVDADSGSALEKLKKSVYKIKK